MITTLYLLTLCAGVQCDYDEYDSHVIEAANPERARQLACEEGGASSRRWLDSKLTSCEPLELVGAERAVIGSFNAG
jgi:hypothetical protein